MGKKNRLVVIDVSNFIFRAFYAIRVLHSPDGTPVNAVHGVLSMFLKLFSTYRPTHVVLARDTSGGSFRNEMYSEYKANRSEPPEDLVPQFSLIIDLINKMDLVHLAHDNYEADDLIGSICVQWKNDFDEIYIASGDKDLMQFVGGNTYMLDTMKDVLYDRDKVYAKMGVYPEQIVDYLSIVGDTSDNIPGMKGIGPKGASKLLHEYADLEACIEAKDSFKGKKLTNAFANHVEEARLSKKLVQIITDIDLDKNSSDTKYNFYPSDELISFLKGLGFKSAIKKLEDLKYAEHKSNDSEGVEESFKEVHRESPYLNLKIETIDKLEELNSLLSKIKNEKNISLYIQYTNDDPVTSAPISLSLCLNEDTVYFVPFGLSQNLTEENCVKFLKDLWEIKNLKISTNHAQNDYRFSCNNNIDINSSLFSINQAHFVLNPGKKHDLESLSEEFLGCGFSKFDELKKTAFMDWDLESASKALCERAFSIYKMTDLLQKSLKENKLLKVFEEIDSPLIHILAMMETNGVAVNPHYWPEMEKGLQSEIDSLTRKILSYSVNDVNLNSPKQVASFLFEELALPVVKKTKSGFSTDAEVLEDLSSRNISDVPAMILKYRELNKIQSTYVQALPKLINKKTSKIHCHFHQDVAATGRLSSDRPNLQNIPIRTELGKKVRKGFIAGPGNLLLTADYSQVELRILAHFSNDKVLVNAFKNDEDIHSQTASQVLGIDLKEVTKNDRSNAKAVNFGLMYGQSSFGLSKSLGISRGEAKEYITTYFERFSSVKSYLDSLKELCEEKGHSETLYGRKRNLPDIYSSNRNIKANAERIAVNSPIQGTAADIIKTAMINIDKEMKEKNVKSKMILQVHDELIFEVPESEIDLMKKLVRDGMENVVKLKVPLKVDMEIGVNWFDIK